MTRTKAKVDISLLAIEPDIDRYRCLKKLFIADSKVESLNGRFLDHLDRIEKAAGDHSVFLYLDPFSVQGFDFERLRRVLSLVGQGRSVELLLNLNIGIFGRIAKSAISEDSCNGPASELLDACVGGQWWREVMEQESFTAALAEVRDKYLNQLRCIFNEVCSHAVYERTHHTVPKYTLVFGSRHPDALVLMNDNMINSARDLVESEVDPIQPGLFDKPDLSPLESVVLANAGKRKIRDRLVYEIVRSSFGQYTSSEICKEVGRQLKKGSLYSATGKARINGKVEVWSS